MPARVRKEQLRVKDVFDVDRTLAVVVEDSTPFREVVRRFAERADLRGIFVVGSDRKLSGVITRQDLLTWARLAFGPTGLETRFSWGRLLRLAQASNAREACHPDSHLASVHPEDTLAEALAKMTTYELIDVPVVDTRGHILGDIRLTEILAKALEIDLRRSKSQAQGCS